MTWTIWGYPYDSGNLNIYIYMIIYIYYIVYSIIYIYILSSFYLIYYYHIVLSTVHYSSISVTFHIRISYTYTIIIYIYGNPVCYKLLYDKQYGTNHHILPEANLYPAQTNYLLPWMVSSAHPEASNSWANFMVAVSVCLARSKLEALQRWCETKHDCSCGWALPLWKIWKSVGMMIPNIYIYVYIYIHICIYI